MTSTISSLRNPLSIVLAGALAGLALGACDLPDKNLGGDPAGTTGGDEPCEPGDTKMEDCNTCQCVDGGWACTEIACGDDSGTDGMSCDPETEPVDECNTCECVGGDWVCTTQACDPTGGTTGDPGGCDPETMPPDDGCNTCDCIEGEWACTDLACPPAPIGVCDGTEPLDQLFVNGASVVGDELMLSVEASGGCEPHVWGSCWDGMFAESDPVQTQLTVTHDANGDPCEAIVSEELHVDLTPMRDAWIAAYMQPTGTIIINVAGWGPVQYDF